MHHKVLKAFLARDSPIFISSLEKLIKTVYKKLLTILEAELHYMKVKLSMGGTLSMGRFYDPESIFGFVYASKARKSERSKVTRHSDLT
jgi:hypothetical protein